MDIKSTAQAVQEWFKTPKGVKVSKIIRYIFLGAIISFLIYQLSQIGFRELWDALPRTIWFYIIFFILYFTLPVTEQFIYRLSLQFNFWDGFKVFTKKKVLNHEVVGYSGEAYFYLWAKENLKESPKKILQVIKDNTIISSLASTLTALVLLVVFSFFVNVNLFDGHWLDPTTLIIGGIILVILFVLLFIFRKQIISVDKKTAWKMFFIHEMRIFWIYTLEVIQWIIVIPSVPIYVWLTFLSVKIISSRIPFLPNKDLLFISASVGIAQYVEISEAAIAGILLCSNVLSKILNLFFFVLFSVDKKEIQIPETE